MDAGFFRCLAREFVPELAGRRLMKAYDPAPDVLALELGPGGRGRYILLRWRGRDPALFLAAAKPAAAAPPSAGAMWLRKRIAGRRILDVSVHWPGRRLALTLSPSPLFPDLGILLLDLRAGASLVCALPEGFGAEPAWPDLARILADPEVWKEFPHLGPALRRTLAALPEDQAAGLLARVQAGNCPIFYVYGTEPLAWPLPDALAGERRPQRFASALDAAEAAGQAMLFPYLEAAARTVQDAAAKAEARRLRRTRESLDRDAGRLAGLAALAETGERLKLVIGRHGSAARLARVAAPLSGGGERGEGVEGTEGAAGAEGLIELDPRLTLAGNLERFFRLAAKGRRGLVHLAARREELARRQAALASGAAPWRPPKEDAPRGKAAPPARTEARAEPFARFRTTEGLAVLRGKNAKANHALLSRVAGHDLWLHAAQGSSAHVVLRRDHPGVEVSEASLAQAAALCANKSAGAGNARVEVMVAEVRHVRKVKGLAPGTVRVDKVWKVLAVAPDPGLETALSVESP
jgi:hypothetical protein